MTQEYVRGALIKSLPGGTLVEEGAIFFSGVNKEGLYLLKEGLKTKTKPQTNSFLNPTKGW